jgi:hypothetical protein
MRFLPVFYRFFLPNFDDKTELKQNAPRSETAEKRLWDTPTGVIACLFSSQANKCPSWAVIWLSEGGNPTI